MPRMLLVLTPKLLNYSFNNMNNAKLTSVSSIFHDLYADDKIGHKIITTLTYGDNLKDGVAFVIQKMRSIVRKYPHFGCIVKNHEWVQVPMIPYEKMIYDTKLTSNEITESLLNMSFDSGIPAWKMYFTSDNILLFVCEHAYGDGEYISNVLVNLFDDTSLNSITTAREKTSFSIVSFFKKIILVVRIITLIIIRFKFATPIVSSRSRVNQKLLSTLSLASLKQIRSRFTCSDGTQITINDLLQTLVTKTNALYFGKTTITSAGMFNMRKNKDDIHDQNNLGYILLANNINDGAPPEEVLCDVHDFMQFYKETPIILLTTNILKCFYKLNSTKTCRLIRDFNQSVDFVISNYKLPVADKTLQGGISVNNINAIVAPCDAKQIYTIISYSDKININVTYKSACITDIDRLQRCFDTALSWISQ